MTQVISRYVLIKPRIWSRIGGYQFGNPIIALNGQYDQYQPIKVGFNDYGFATYKELIIDYYCRNQGTFKARLKPDDYELRVVCNKHFKHTEKLRKSDVDIIAFHKNDSAPKDKLSFVLNQDEYESLIKGCDIYNQCYQEKKQSWISKKLFGIFAPLADDDCNNTDNHVVNTQQQQQTPEASNFTSVVLDAEIVESPQSVYEKKTNTLEAVTHSIVEPKNATIEIVSTQSTSIANTPKKSKASKNKSFASMAFKSIGIGALAGSALYFITSTSKPFLPTQSPNQQVQNSTPVTIDIVPKILNNVDSAKVVEFDSVMDKIVPQQESVCNSLKTPPDKLNYQGQESSYWFKVDNGKHLECKLKNLMNQVSRIPDKSKSDLFKSQNASSATILYNQSLEWYRY